MGRKVEVRGAGGGISYLHWPAVGVRSLSSVRRRRSEPTRCCHRVSGARPAAALRVARVITSEPPPPSSGALPPPHTHQPSTLLPPSPLQPHTWCAPPALHRGHMVTELRRASMKWHFPSSTDYNNYNKDIIYIYKIYILYLYFYF